MITVLAFMRLYVEIFGSAALDLNGGSAGLNKPVTSVFGIVIS